ncbi:MAG: hypothetical protein GY757_31255 [bacterium]|nr:hypothetical protein [bacterium]
MKKRLILFVLALCLIFGINSVYAVTKLKRLGRSPFYKGGETIEAGDVSSIIFENSEDVKLGFSKAGAISLYSPFMEQLKPGALEEISVYPGEILMWMIYRKGKRVKVFNDVEWAGKRPFSAFRYVVEHNDDAYEFIIPKICINIALKSITAVPPPVAEAVVAPPPEPEEPTPAAPTPAPRVAATPPPPPPKNCFFVGDAGLLRMDPPPETFHLPLRAGYMCKVAEQLAVVGLIGGAPLLSGCGDRPAFLGDAILAFYPVSRFFIGAGAGWWHTSEKTRADAVVKTGFHLTENVDAPNVVLYLEGRSAFDEFDRLSEDGRFGGGLQLHF